MSPFPPRLSLHAVTVRAARMADGRETHVFATAEGFRIRNRWVSVQLSAHIVRALQSGDLEELGPGDRALTPAEIAAKYGAGTIERAAEKLSLPALAPGMQDVVAPASAQRRKGRPKGTSAEVRRENEQVAALIAGGEKPYRAYRQVAVASVGDDAALVEDKRVSVERNFQRFLKGPTKRPKQSLPTKIDPTK